MFKKSNYKRNETSYIYVIATPITHNIGTLQSTNKPNRSNETFLI